MPVNISQENFFHSFDKVKLFYQEWKAPQPKGLFVITHGLGAHSEHFQDFAKYLNKAQWSVLAWDLRGHGRSQGQRGYAQNINEYEKDLHHFLNLIDKKYHLKGKPTLGYGHSLGGLISLKTLLAYGPQNLSGVVISCPLLGLALEVPAYKLRLGEWAAKYFPRLTLPTDIELADLSSDKAWQEERKKDIYFHNKIAPKLFFQIQDAFQQIPEMSSQIKLPLLMQLGERDTVVCFESAQRTFDKIGSQNKKLYTYPLLHEIHNDIGKDEVFKDLTQWIKDFEK